MTVLSLTQTGEYHIVIRIKGTPEKIHLFHKVMLKCDPEWPWKTNTVSMYVCKRCAGMSYHSPRVTPHDIKVAAKQTGVRVKIRNFAPIKNCRGGNVSYDYMNDRQRVTVKEIHELYQAHGTANFFAKYIGTHPTTSPLPILLSPPPPIVTAVTAVPPAPPPSEAILIDTVLADQEPVDGETTHTPYGSLNQDRTGETSYEDGLWDGYVM